MTTGPQCVPIAALLCGVLLLGCDGGDAVKAPGAGLNVVLISMDTTRADHLACYGHPRIKTPNIDRLAAEGVLFTQCTAAVPITLPSHASMLTGTYPFVHKIRDNGFFRLHPDNLTVTEALRDAGYATAAQVGSFVLNHEFGLDQGFTVYCDVRFGAAGMPDQRADAEISAEQVTDGAIRLLRESVEEPFFLLVHYYDPHLPYEAPPRFASQYIEPYVAEIAYTDEQIGRLLAALEQAGLAERTLIILTSDHGEGLGQHHEDTHGYFVYDATLSVPLIVCCPGRIPEGLKITAQVRTVDIAPTVLAFLGLPPLPDAQGVDLFPLLDGSAPDLHLEAYAETFPPRYNLGFSQLRALRDGSWKYIHAPRPELYHVADDQHELDDLAVAQPQRVAEMRARLRALLERAPRVVEAGQARRQVSPDDLRALEALGYVSGSQTADADDSVGELDLFEPLGPNPIEHVQEIHLTTRALGLIQAGRHQEVERVIRTLLTEAGPRAKGLVWAHAHLAGALAAQGKLEEALQHFQSAIEAKPGDSQIYTMKGMVLRALRRDEEALAVFQHAATLEPVFAITHLHLGATLAAAGRSDEAIEQFQLAVEKDPLMVRAHAGLAQLVAAPEQVAEAVEALERALKLARKTEDPKILRQLRALRARYQRRGPLEKTP